MNWWLKSVWLAALLGIGCALIYTVPDVVGRIVMAVTVFAVFARRAWKFTHD
jgi:hypothetical protein